MGTRGKWRRRFWRIGGTLAIGAMLGFLVPTIVSEFTPQPEEQAQIAESAVAREFIDAFVSDNHSVLERLKVTSDVIARATRLKTEVSKVDRPVHLGSTVVGPYSLHAYASSVVLPDGNSEILSWRVVTAAGQVGLLLPPSPIEPNP